MPQRDSPPHRQCRPRTPARAAVRLHVVPRHPQRLRPARHGRPAADRLRLAADHRRQVPEHAGESDQVPAEPAAGRSAERDAEPRTDGRSDPRHRRLSVHAEMSQCHPEPRRRRRIPLATGSLAALGMTLAANALVFVTNERAGTLSVIDHDRVVATTKLCMRARGIALSPDGRRLYVAVSHFRDKPATSPDEVVAVDAATFKIVKHYKAGTDPEGIAMSPDGKWFTVSNEDAGTASIVATRDGSTMAALVTGTEPEGVGVSPDGRWVYVTGETSNTITVIDAKMASVVDNTMVAARPRGVAFTPDGARAYVTCEVAGAVDVVDVAGRRVVARIKLRPVDHPVGVTIKRNGRIVFAATGRGNAIVKIDTATNRVLQTIAAGQRPWGIALSRDGKTLYAANGLSNDVSVIDVAAGRAVATIRVGDGPWGVCVGR